MLWWAPTRHWAAVACWAFPLSINLKGTQHIAACVIWRVLKNSLTMRVFDREDTWENTTRTVHVMAALTKVLDTFSNDPFSSVYANT